MKKTILVILLLISVTSVFYSQETDEPSNFHNHFINTSFTVPFSKEYQNDYLSMNLGYRYENLYTKASCGLQTAESNIKFFMNDTLWLINQTKHNKNNEEYFSLRFGLKTFFNIIHYNNLVTYYNILFGQESTFNIIPDTFSISTEFMFDATIGNIDTDDTDSIIINWWDFAFKVSFLYIMPFQPELTLYLDMSNYDDSTLQRFYAPIFSLGVKYDSPYKFSTSAEFNLHYTDLFSFSRYLEYAAFTLKGEYRF